MIPVDFKIQVFLALEKTGSFTKAAAKLGVSQPAVSQNISELERSLGQKLFERVRGGVEITEAGKFFLEYATSIAEDYRKMNAALDNPQDDPSRKLNLYLSPVIKELIGNNLLSTIYILRPEIEINTSEIMEEADICVNHSGVCTEDSKVSMNVSISPEEHPLYPLVKEALALCFK